MLGFSTYARVSDTYSSILLHSIILTYLLDCEWSRRFFLFWRWHFKLIQQRKFKKDKIQKREKKSEKREKNRNKRDFDREKQVLLFLFARENASWSYLCPYVRAVPCRTYDRTYEILGKGFITKNMAKSEGLFSVYQSEWVLTENAN